MLDFNTKKEILRSLREKRNRNKLLWLPCVIAELFVKLWYAVICSVDMALSDKEGNFLGMKRSRTEKVKTRKKDDIINVHKPLWGRLLSAVLAVSFVFMMVPDLGILDFDVFAASEVEEVGNSVIFDGVAYTLDPEISGDNYYYYKNDEYLYAKQKTVENVGFYIGSSAVRVWWEKPIISAEYINTVEVASYTVTLYVSGTGEVVETKTVPGTGSLCDFTNKKTNTDYFVRVKPTFNVQLYQYIPAVKDENGTITVPASIPPVPSRRFSVIGSEYEQVIGLLNAAMGIPVVEKFDNDEPLVLWNKVVQNYGDVKDIGKDADGYIVYRRTYNGAANTYGSWQELAAVPFNRYLTEDIATEYDVTDYIENPAGSKTDSNRLYYVDSSTVKGAIYDYYVMAYRNVVGSSAYDSSDPFTINSGDAGAHSPKRLYNTPNAPASVVVKSDKKNTLNVSWKPGKGQNTGYVLYRSDDFLSTDTLKTLSPNGDDTKNPYYNAKTGTLDYSRYIMDKAKEITRVTTDTLAYPDSDEALINTEDYYYYVMAFLDTGDGNYIYSQPTSASGKIDSSLYPPQGLLAEPSDGRIDVKWDKVDGADGYKLHITKIKNNDGTTTGCGKTTVVYLTKNSYPHVGLYNNEVYSYKVQAYINATSSSDPSVEDYDKVLSDFSDTRTATVGETLGVPQDLTLKTSDGKIDVSWSKVSGAEGYELYYRCNNGTWKKIDVSNTKFSHTRLNNGDVYDYYVRAYKVVNGVTVYGENSNEVSVMVGNSLDAPKDFIAETEDGVVNLSWSKVKGAEGYVLYAYCDGKYYEIDLSKTKYEHIDVHNGEKWTYYLKAYKTVNGERFFSDSTKSITVTVGETLNAVMDLIATAGNRQIDLSWSKVKGAEGYIVYLYDEDTMEFEPLTITSKLKYSHTGLKNGQPYTYMVAPFKTINGERHLGDYSMEVTCIPTTGSPTDVDRVLNIKGTTPYGISHSEYISAKANHDAFEESVDVYITTNQESTKAVKDVLKNYANGLSSFIIYPFDISVYKENTLIKVDPADGYTITMTIPIPDKLIAYRDYLTVVHINENIVEDVEETEWYDIQDQRLEVLPCAILDIDNVWCVQFVCSSFSPYAFVIYKEHLNDVSAGGGVFDGSFAGTFNSGMLLLTTLPDIMPNNKKLKVERDRKKYHIKNRIKK